MKPSSPASERNKQPILVELKRLLPGTERVLEIGSGTGQHAVHFAGSLPDITWITSDRLENHTGIASWMASAGLDNLTGPLELDVTMVKWPVLDIDAVYSANTAHIMSWPEVEQMFAGIARLLHMGCQFFLYGPFNYGGRFVSASNQAFDASLKSQQPHMGLRDLDDLTVLAARCGLTLQDDIEMPANNRLLVWEKR